jgi:hypothetical protein
MCGELRIAPVDSYLPAALRRKSLSTNTLDRGGRMSIEIAHREDVTEGVSHVELDVDGSRSLYVTTCGETTSIVLADSAKERQASISVEDGEWSVRED